jgi:hypothetical protein
VPLLDRYQRGEHEGVYRALVEAAGDDEEAHAVARALMERVRSNLEDLAARWRVRGFCLARPIGEPEAACQAIGSIEQAHGPLPPALRALYQVMSWIDFIEEPPGPPWPDREQLDSIAFHAVEPQLDDLIGVPAPELQLFDDFLVKFGLAGVGSIYVPLPAQGFDPELHFEGQALLGADGSTLRLVPYLRATILERGGMGLLGAPEEELDPSLLRELTTGLIPF